MQPPPPHNVEPPSPHNAEPPPHDVEPAPPHNVQPLSPPLPKAKGYNLNFLDDPDFNPFETKDLEAAPPLSTAKPSANENCVRAELGQSAASENGQSAAAAAPNPPKGEASWGPAEDSAPAKDSAPTKDNTPTKDRPPAKDSTP